MLEDKKISITGIAYSFFREYGHEIIGGEEKQILRYWHKNFYLWKKGIYNEVDKEEIEARLVIHISSLGQSVTTGLMANVVLNLGALAFVPKKRVPDTWFTSNEIGKPDNAIVLENGIIVLGDNGSVEIREHTPDFFALTKLPYAYDPKATCPRWDKFLDEVTFCNKELQRTLKQWAGYTLSPLQIFEVLLILLGEAGTGKGTYKRTLMAMNGNENCSEVPLRRFTDKYSLSITYGKKLNTAPDAESELTPQVEAIIRTWTGEDGLDYERKYLAGFTARPTAKLMILANEFPKFTDKTMGTWRRLIVVPFGRENLEYRDPTLESTLKRELPGILNWAIEGLRDLLEEMKFHVAESSRVILTAHQEESNPARVFLMEHYKYDLECKLGTPTALVYQAYRGWCKCNGFTMPLSNPALGKEIKRIFPQVGKPRRLGNKDRFYLYSRLTLQPGANITPYLK